MPTRPVTQEPGFVLLHGRAGPENYRSFDRLFRPTAGRLGKIGDDMARQEGCGSLFAGQNTLRIFRRGGQKGIGIFVAEKVVRDPAASSRTKLRQLAESKHCARFCWRSKWGSRPRACAPGG